MDSSIVLASIFVVYCLCLNMATIDSLRTGAPFIACGSLTPIHALYQAKPATSAQFYISQSSSEYSSKTNITVTIGSHSEGQYFRGFMIQAYDPVTNQRIGHFTHTTDSRPMHSCSVATHRNSEKKVKLQLTWTSVGEEVHRHSVRPLLNIGHMGPLLVARERVTDLSPIHRSDSTVKRVKFRGTFVVSFSDFYTGFQSIEIDQSIKKSEQSTTIVQPSPPIVVAPATENRKSADYGPVATQQESPLAANKQQVIEQKQSQLPLQPQPQLQQQQQQQPQQQQVKVARAVDETAPVQPQLIQDTNKGEPQQSVVSTPIEQAAMQKVTAN